MHAPHNVKATAIRITMVTQQLVRMSICTSAFIQQGSFVFASALVNRHRLSTFISYDNNRNNKIYCIDNNRIHSQTMPRGVKKENLPTKTCIVCNRPFTWRKKWEKVWDEVTTCSKSCNRKRKEKNRQLNRAGDSSNSATDDPFVAISNSSECGSENEEQLIMSSICDDVQALEVTNTAADSNLIQEDETSEKADDLSTSESSTTDAVSEAKLRRKAEKKRKKAERRAQREGKGDPTAGQKKCTLCSKSVNLLIRCTYDKSGEWGMVCGKCWNDVSGGVVDGDDAHPHYRYGGLWKNRRAQQT
jgi:hypothetical protein